MRVCAICAGDIKSGNPSQKTCGHPRCSNTYRRQKPERDRARRAAKKTRPDCLPRRRVVDRMSPDIDGRRSVVEAMDDALGRGHTFDTAVLEAAIASGNPPAVVMSVWRSVRG